MKRVDFYEVAQAWLAVDMADLAASPIQIQRALASVNVLIVHLDRSWRDEPRERRTQARELLREAVAVRKALEKLSVESFTNGTRAGKLSTNIRKQYRDLLRHVLDWCKLVSPQSADFFKSVMAT